MIEISRVLARRLRAVFRKAFPIGTTRGQRPPLTLHTGKDGLVVRSHHPDVVVEYHGPGAFPPGEVFLPGEALDDFEGRGADNVTLEMVVPETVRANWKDGGVPQNRDYHSPDRERLLPIPAQPQAFAAVEPCLLRALDDASRCVAGDGSRFSISKIQLRGRKGEMIATDGKQLLLQRGFTFCWDEDVLIPTLGVFGCKELSPNEQVVLGRTETHLCLRVGLWTFYLTLDTTGRFPNAENVIPSLKGTHTTCTLSPEDAGFLAQALPRLPGKGRDHEPVTLDLNGHVAVRARAEGQEKATELTLSRSTVSGSPMRVVCNRLYLAQAIGLGFLEIQVGKASAPIVCRDERRIYLFMTLGQVGAVSPANDHLHVNSVDIANGSPPPPATVPVFQHHHEKRQFPMATRPEEPVNGNDQHTNGHSDSAPGLDELIQEAESLRTALITMCGRVAQLTANLKRHRKRGRAVEAALSALRLKLPVISP